MGLDLQPDGLTAGLAGHCQPDKKISLVSERLRLQWVYKLQFRVKRQPGC